MKLFRILPLLMLLVLWSCGDQEREVEEEVAVEEETVDPNEIISEWEEAWNSNEPQNVKDLMAVDAVLVTNGEEFPQDSISSWVDRAGAGMKDLNMNSLQKGYSEGIIYDSGTFSHGNRDNDTLQFNGTYTFIWEKPEGSDAWEVVLMNISDVQNESSNPEED